MYTMFSNYRPGVHTSHSGCGCHDSALPPSTDALSPVQTVTDEYGNLTELRWSPTSRFNFEVVSDSWLPIVPGSTVLGEPGQVPGMYMNSSEGALAYNISDYKCWKFTNGQWVEQNEIITSPSNGSVVRFSSRNCITRVSIKNFRGESIYTAEDKDSSVTLSVDDSLSNLLRQGYYNMDVYQLTPTSTRLIRRVPISIGYSVEDNSPTIPNPGGHHSGGIVTDSSLVYSNGVLSVNTLSQCVPGVALPVSSEAVYEYAQPRTLTIDVIDIDDISPIFPIDIYSYIRAGGDVICLYNNLSLKYVSGTNSIAEFGLVRIEDNVVISDNIIIQSDGKMQHTQLRSETSTSSGSSESYEEIMLAIDGVAAQVTEKTDELRVSINELSDRIGEIDIEEELHSLSESVDNISSNVSNVETRIVDVEEDIEDIRTEQDRISTQLKDTVKSDEVNTLINENLMNSINRGEFDQIITEAVGQLARFDGGVII